MMSDQDRRAPEVIITLRPTRPLERPMSTIRTPRPATAQDLWTIARHWDDLHDALTAQAVTWPPAMGIPTITHTPDSDAAEAATWRAEALRRLERDPAQPGWTAAPLRLGVLDTIRTVEAALVELADQVADQVQRPQITPAPPRRAIRTTTPRPGFDFAPVPTTDRARRVQENDDRRRDLLAMRDARDPRRWQLPASGRGAPRTDWGRRNAPRAALWLLARVQHAPGPVHRHLTVLEADRIASVARGTARLVERALDTGDERARISAPCPACSGRIIMHGGGGAAPIARCTGCGGIW
ncbi:hypothetical protein ACIOHE_15790 [Streptomyces sp. NPDC087851]|uniref:hypothetical protein n=1 Tax=Streptomyces sp. NPDC087851 TaxID=3365810 RepID=UPI0037FC0E47